ncbi:MAG: hypothetical protein LBQ28_03665 [Prevotellaceae bacterium]|jgi:hypothetical protein|nr:hypothetical protein [Prevotellaceae bacterium]
MKQKATLWHRHLRANTAIFFRRFPQSVPPRNNIIFATPAQINNPKMVLFQALPAQFDRAKCLEIAAQLQITESTADKQKLNKKTFHLQVIYKLFIILRHVNHLIK